MMKMMSLEDGSSKKKKKSKSQLDSKMMKPVNLHPPLRQFLMGEKRYTAHHPHDRMLFTARQ